MKFTELNLETDVLLNEYNNKSISFKDTIRFQIPRMYMPFGVSGFAPPVGATKWNIDFNMKGYDEEGGYVKKFYEFVRDLENVVISHVEERSVEIFGKKRSREELEQIFNSNIKHKYDEPKFRVKIDDKVAVFDSQDTDCTPETLSDGLFRQNSGVALVELGNVYFINNMFGFTWRVVQMKVYEPQRLKGFMFKDV